MARNRPRPRRHRPPPRGGGFTADGLVPAQKMLSPFRGPQLRAYFNNVSRLGAIIAGLAGLGIGWELAGGLGAVIGCGLGFAWAAQALTRRGYYRP